MADELVFYTNPMSRGQTIRWMLEELAVPYETVLLDYDSSMQGAEYLAINPMGKVPAIRHNGQVVTESAAICLYLADAYPAAELGPRPEERASYYRWAFFGAGPFEQATVNGSVFGAPPQAEQGRMLGYGSLEKTMAAVDGWLSQNEYFCGPRFTAVDVSFGMNLRFNLEFQTAPGTPALEAYVERIKARPAYARAQAIDAAHMPDAPST